MLGAQALRTKQKVEQKEREKRQRARKEREQTQRESIQKAANEDAQAAMLEFAAQQATASSAHIKQRHSLHTTALNDHFVPLSARDASQLDVNSHPTRSPSTDYGKATDGSGSSSNRLMRWLGLSSNTQKKQKQRRMSTY
ncbi:hypothetical protein M3Y95_00051800 [Aphelenchoides besseyi]|nr:hypothetical protein M3Y95_00051800 [Aphelenchoides besseyi]